MPFWNITDGKENVKDHVNDAPDGEAKPVKWPEEQLDEHDVELPEEPWEPDEELDDWQDDVKVDLEFKPDEESQEWNGDVEEDPFWDEHQNHANESSKPVE